MVIWKTHLARQLEATEAAGKKQSYDAQIKQVLSNRDILAWILKIPPQNEGTIYYDILFYVILPNGEKTKIIIDIEAQNKYHPGYDIVTRGVFYGARMLSSQLDTEFSADNYDDLKKVYSIWICMDTPELAANTITEYSITPKYIHGKNRIEARYDLLSVVMICLGKDSDKGAEIHKLLTTLLSPDLKAEEKENILESQYHIPVTEHLKEDIFSMCNLSDWVEERGVERGREDGIGILIDSYLEDDKDKAFIIKKLMKRYQLSDEEAADKYEKYAAKKDE